MMPRFEPEPRAVKPPDFDAWLDELGLVADCEGEWALIGTLWRSPRECCAYLATIPGMWASLLTRARYADFRRFYDAVWMGHRA
jgi:hypothetical protein